MMIYELTREDYGHVMPSFAAPLLPARLLRRYKRFLADVVIDGEDAPARGTLAPRKFVRLYKWMRTTWTVRETITGTWDGSILNGRYRYEECEVRKPDQCPYRCIVEADVRIQK